MEILIEHETTSTQRQADAETDIREWISQMPEASFVAVADVPINGLNRGLVKQTLNKLVLEGELMLVEHDTWFTPVRWAKTGQVNFWETFNTYTAQADETITCTVGTAANALGLVDQCPMREARFTTGRSREIKIGNLTYDLQHVPAWQTLLGDTTAGLAIRYFAWGNKPSASRSAQRLNEILQENDWQKIQQVFTRLPMWIRTAITEVRNVN